MPDIYEESDYRIYLNRALGKPGQRTGSKTAAARAIACHTTYLSQVLGGRADLSLEQADLLNDFLNHTAEEADLFLLLVAKARAGTARLKRRYAAQIEELRARRLVIRDRIKQKTTITTEDEAKFYSSATYGVVHVLSSIPSLKTRDAIAAYLKLPVERVAGILEFLEKIGLVERTGDRFAPGTQMVHLGNDSHNIVKHHLNWRLRAMRAVEEHGASGTHYSAAVSLSRADALKIKQILVDNLAKNLEIIGASKEEVAYGYCFDFFELKA